MCFSFKVATLLLECLYIRGLLQSSQGCLVPVYMKKFCIEDPISQIRNIKIFSDVYQGHLQIQLLLCCRDVSNCVYKGSYNYSHEIFFFFQKVFQFIC